MQYNWGAHQPNIAAQGYPLLQIAMSHGVIPARENVTNINPAADSV